jgi:probable 2-oxoglutarate dehydrogenase E1 component DHKTD1
MSPFPKDHIKKEMDRFTQAKDFVWCQEEPQNAGAYAFMAPRLAQLVPPNKVTQDFAFIFLFISSLLIGNPVCGS